MATTDRRFAVNLISPIVLAQYIEHRQLSLAKLAEAVTDRGVRTSKATIGHLTSGHVKRTNAKRARAIAAVLDVPVKVLFSDPRPSIVQMASSRAA